MIRIHLQFCSSRDLLPFEQRHYVQLMDENDPCATKNSVKAGKPRGHQGQQIHYLIWVKTDAWKNVGAMSGGSGAFGVGIRDRFFGLDKFPKPKKRETSPYLSGIIDNTLYRLEYVLDRSTCAYSEEDTKRRKCLNPDHYHYLAGKIIALWRKQVVKDWEFMYGVKPYGFETFVDEKRSSRSGWGDQYDSNPSFTLSKGGLYIADNWTCVGSTQGSAKDHVGKGLTGGLRGKPFRRRKVPIKIVYCKWLAPFTEPQACEYKSSWRGETPEEKARAKELSRKRRQRTQEALALLKKEGITP